MYRYKFIFLVVGWGATNIAFAQENVYETPGVVKEVTELSVDEYTRLALQESITARISRHNLGANTFNRQATYLSLRFPTLTANGSASRTETKGKYPDPNSKIILDNQANIYDTSLSYAQPIYFTGGSVQTILDQTETTSVSEGVNPTFSGRKPQVNMTFTQPFFVFVKDPNRRTWRRAELGYENQLDGYEIERLGVVFDARNLYYQALLTLAQLGVEKKKLVSSREVQRITQALVDAGRLAPNEFNRAAIRFHNDERQLQNVRVAYWQILNQAKDKVGMPRDAVAVFTSTLTYTPFNATLEKLIEYSYIHQPSIRSARRNVELSQISLVESQEATRPKFNFNSALGLANTTGGTIADVQRNWSTGLSFSYLFFDSRKAYYTVLANKENLEIARLQLQAAERNTQVAVSNAYVDVKRAEEQISGFDVNKTQALENVKVVRARFGQGLDRLIDVFDAESQSRAIDLEYLNLLFSFSRSVDGLSQLIGGDSTKIR